MSTIAYNTTRQTIVETLRQPSTRTLRRHAAAARQAPQQPVIDTSGQREDNPHLVVAVESPKPEYWEFGQDSGLVLIVARVSCARADIMKLCFEA